MNLQRLVRRFQHFPRSTTVLIASRSISSNQRRCTEYNSPRNDQYIEVSRLVRDRGTMWLNRSRSHVGEW